MAFCRSRAGFTLVEIIVALTILGAIALAFMQVYQTNAFAIFTSGERSQALFRAQMQMEAAIATEPEEPVEHTINFPAGPDVISFAVSGEETAVEVAYGRKGGIVSLTALVLERVDGDPDDDQ